MRTRKHKRTGSVLPAGTYRKWATMFRPELVEGYIPPMRQKGLFVDLPASLEKSETASGDSIGVAEADATDLGDTAATPPKNAAYVLSRHPR